MKKRLLLSALLTTVILIAVFSSTGFPMGSKLITTDDYYPATTYAGVTGYWKAAKQPYGKAYEVLFKFTNNNPYSVDVDYEATFDCGKKTGGLISLSRGETKSGEGAGLWDYPCKDNEKPTRIYMKIKVIRK